MLSNQERLSQSGNALTVTDESCDITFTGTFAVTGTGMGTMTIAPSGSCVGGAPPPFQIQLAGKGDVGVISLHAPRDSSHFGMILTGSFAKQ
jgi:hypothetical protein